MIFIIIGWIICGVLHFGMFFAYFQRQYSLIADDDRHTDIVLGMITGLGGPLALVVDFIWYVILGKPFHGFKYN